MKKIIIFLILLFSLTSCAKVNIEDDYKKSNELENIYSNNLIIHYIDVGQGDSIFIELPNHKSILIDAGEASSSEKIINYIKDLDYTKIDYVVSTHPHADHIGGLAKVIDTFDIGNIYMPKVVATSKTYENLLTTISNKNLKIKTGKAGVEIIKEDELEAVIVAPNKEKYPSYNNYSIVVKLIYGNTSYLFTGDAEEISENEIKNNIDVDVLKVGHHGSNTSSSIEFLKRVTPEYAIISVGENNKYNHPSESTIENLKKYTNNIYRTDLNGTIILTSDGEKIEIKTEK